MNDLTFSPHPGSDPDLLVRPFPGREEGPQGYLLRLSEVNCLRVSELIQLGIRYDPVWLARHRLLPDPALDPDLRAHVARLAQGLTNTGRIWNHRHARFCPLCLADEPLWRAGWELYFHDVCPRHGVWLVDQCGSCGQPLRWNRDALLRCQCGSDLRQETAKGAPENPRHLSAFLEARLLGRDAVVPVPMEGLDVDQVQRLIRYLGCYMDLGSGAKPLKLRNAGRMEISWSVTALAAEIVFDWPRAFHDSLNRLQESSAGEKTGLRGLFRNAYHYLYKGFREAAFRPLRESFELWLAEHWKGGLARRNRRLPAELLASVQWIPGTVAANQLKISIARLRNLVREGRIDGQESVSTTGRRFLVVRRDQLDQISSQLVGEMSMAAAMEMLGIGKVRMQRILRLLFPSARRTFDKAFLPWCVPRAEVDGLLAIGAHLPVQSIPDEQQVSLGYVFKYWTWSADEIVALVEAVKAGSLVPQAMLNSARGISRWVFETAQLRAWQQRLNKGPPKWVSIPEFARILGVKQQVAYWITQNGLVRAERLGVLKDIGSRIRWEDVERYRQTYVFGREIAEILRCSSRKAARLLAEQGIYPVRGHSAEPSRQLIYARSDEIQRFLVQATGASPGAFKLVRSLGPGDSD